MGSAKRAKWETACSGSSLDNSLPQSPRLFLPALLTDPDIAFLAVCQNDNTIAGAIANRTDNEVGLSNLFAPPEDSMSFWASCEAIAEERFPGLPLMGYVGNPRLALAEAVGLEKLENLKVWVFQQ